MKVLVKNWKNELVESDLCEVIDSKLRSTSYDNRGELETLKERLDTLTMVLSCTLELLVECKYFKLSQIRKMINLDQDELLKIKEGKQL